MKMPLGYDDIQILNAIASERGIKVERIKTIFKGQKRKMIAKDFDENKTYILRQANHWVALVNGNLIDTWDSSKRAVYYALQIN